jgi:hypothetical protein
MICFIIIGILQIINLQIIPNGIYLIKNLDNIYYLTIENNKLILSSKQTNFRIILIKSNNIYIIETKHKRKKLGIDDNDKIILYNYYKDIINPKKIFWYITQNSEKEFFIQNVYNHKYLEINNNSFECSVNFIKENYIKNFKFKFLKMVEEGILNKKYLDIIKKEPIDVVIKYIDLTDKELNREGIIQIYKDKDNEELRFSIRSIIQYIPWIRKIYILMPNKKVRFLKSIDEINNKIIYINDKEMLGFDSANIHAFTFKLYNLEKFGVSKNFIYMEDDFFIGKPLNKTDFFYYDEQKKKVLPYLLTKYFQEMNKSEVLNQYYNLFANKELIHPHSYNGWWLSIYGTDKYFMERYTYPLIINTNFTHNALAENIDELREIFEEIQYYEFINETLYSKERHILTLNQPHFYNLYQLNIKKKKVHTIPYRYILVQSIKGVNLDIPLFVINTDGNHQPTKRQYKIQKKIMEKRFPLSNEYEIINKNTIKILIISKIFLVALRYFFIFIIIKIINIL